MSEATRTDIRTFIIDNFLFGDESQPLPDDLSLIDNDLVDSTGILELVSFIEEHFEVKIEDADIVPANLDTIGKIVAFIDRKRVH
ncbi:acyl carrier protein [Rhizobium sp. Root482]|jgi:acyl carrier protein|uniref:acyl carrier protein n=1 Tax=Rhizobium sp. Root482 TaxID=1736543 RepID=UPI0006FDA9DD|nr:acyl carrier protein [Rhizobium sp. Root482]KQY13912.1 acyl carrier protein [Rhizobium sp. Root482]